MHRQAPALIINAGADGAAGVDWLEDLSDEVINEFTSREPSQRDVPGEVDLASSPHCWRKQHRVLTVLRHVYLSVGIGDIDAGQMNVDDMKFFLRLGSFDHSF